MSKIEILEQIKRSAKQLKNDYAEDLEYNRERGNYKFEITPGNIQDAYMKGAEKVLNLLGIE